MKDRVFKQSNRGRRGSFTFDREVVKCFDDMLRRSVPGYDEIQDLIAGLVSCQPQVRHIVDIGCSTGNTLMRLCEVCPKGVHLHGLDRSPEMLRKARRRLATGSDQLKLSCVDLEKGLAPELVSEADVVVSCLTLQFIKPSVRMEIVKTIRRNLRRGGIFLLIEKISAEDLRVERVYRTLYYQWKRDAGYSDLEIRRKELALKGVLRPATDAWNREMLSAAGFTRIECFFRWLNFIGYVAHPK